MWMEQHRRLQIDGQNEGVLINVFIYRIFLICDIINRNDNRTE